MPNILTILLLILTVNTTAQISDTSKWHRYSPNYNETFMTSSDLTNNLFVSGPDFHCRISILGKWGHGSEQTPKWKEGGISLSTNRNEFKRPLWVTLVSDTAHVLLDSMLLDLLSNANVIEVGGRRFKLAEQKPVMNTWHGMKKLN